ncbi:MULTISPECIES: SDR family oxidoreductase [unclassified Beijerinckia]|uniref:SDR family NAD(P)-dependent oxidoreductase n=1 Tax=unclassified Beijerinckia TaxID=2638183 RepID=UPI00089B602E|nr:MULTISPECIES: SDR family oxidoreductase [unclassified Beijerinckia]MDH7797839.1 NAD(P)-dependent dehydrogenase (short-subunit alcohol dehydrogenase family) [Beijerinckia sp. GAS462]SED00301.1 3-oxoacyl-[acyl-carrier protein] reductase [Beijerinckia sp. 28-YEA-48]
MTDIALVTGGTGAIGAAISAVLQARGLHVIAADLDVRPVAAGQSFFKCDVTDPQSLVALFDHAQTLGTIRCVVAAHGILLETQAGASDPTTIAKVLNINLNGVAYLCDLAGTRLANGSSLLLLSSVTAFMGRAKGAYAYQASKAGVESLTRTFAVAYGPRGIRVNCIAPGFMAVPMKGAGAELRQKQGGSDTVGKAAPLGQVIAPEEIASAAAFLCSAEAAAITGVVLPVDGGFAAL